MFVVVNKLADALGFEMLTPETYDQRASMALEHGYAIPPQGLEWARSHTRGRGSSRWRFTLVEAFATVVASNQM